MSIPVPALSQVPVVLNQITNGFEGIARIATDSPQGIAVVGLRTHYNQGTGLVAAMPAIPQESVQSSDPLFLPQIVEGGGFSTKLVLFNGTDAEQGSGSVQFVSQSGQDFDAVPR
jgi:hypothetical protein